MFVQCLESEEFYQNRFKRNEFIRSCSCSCERQKVYANLLLFLITSNDDTGNIYVQYETLCLMLEQAVYIHGQGGAKNNSNKLSLHSCTFSYTTLRFKAVLNTYERILAGLRSSSIQWK